MGGVLNIAPVRNLKSIGRPKPIPVRHFIPPIFAPIYKIEVVTDTETIDLTELLVEGNYSDGVTNSIGDFEFKILDPNNNNSDKIEEFDTINIYLDYGKIATTLRFTGKIERISSQNQIYLVLSGRSLGMITTGTNITYSSNGPMARSDILKAIINTKDIDGTTPKYFNGDISDAGIEDDLTEIEVNYEEMPFWAIVEEICISGGRDAYVSSSSVFNYFVKGSRTNPSEAVVEDINLVETIEYARDTQEVYTKVRVYGQRINNVPIIATTQPDTSNTKGIIKELKIDNNSITSTEQALELAQAEAEDKKLPPTIGSIISLMLPTLLPGEKVNIANPTNNIPPGEYEINSFRHIFSAEDSPKTEITIKKQRVELSTILKSNIKFQSDIPDSVNKYDLDFSHIINFDTSSGAHDDTVINEGYLKVAPGAPNGSWVSDIIPLNGNVEKLELRWNGENLTQSYNLTTSKLWYSFTGGAPWTPFILGISAPDAGSQLRIRVDLNDPSAKTSMIVALYKINYDS